MPVIIGTGPLSWDGEERRSRRYGLVALTHRDSNTNILGDWWLANSDLEDITGLHGRLIATVLESRDSTHEGDNAHGIYPDTPEVGEQIVLGEGYVRVGPKVAWGSEQFGVQPSDHRVRYWMDVRALYRAHEQTVRISFEETPVSATVEKPDYDQGESDGCMIIIRDGYVQFSR